LRAFIIAIPQPPAKMRGLIIATRQDKEEKKIDVNFYLNVRFRFRICMSLIPCKPLSCLPLIKVNTHFPWPLYTHFSRD